MCFVICIEVQIASSSSNNKWVILQLFKLKFILKYSAIRDPKCMVCCWSQEKREIFSYLYSPSASQNLRCIDLDLISIIYMMTRYEGDIEKSLIFMWTDSRNSANCFRVIFFTRHHTLKLRKMHLPDEKNKQFPTRNFTEQNLF